MPDADAADTVSGHRDGATSLLSDADNLVKKNSFTSFPTDHLLYRAIQHCNLS